MKLINSIIFSILATSVIAQTELPTGQIEVIKDFEVRLLETNKIRIIPLPIELDTTMRRYEYKLLAPSPSIDYEVPELKPLSINTETKPAYYPLFAKAGYGSPNSFLGEFSYDRRQTDVFQWGVDFRHLSANNKKIPLQKFSDSRARINASYDLTEDLQLDGYIDGHFETVYFYGAEDIPSNPDALKRSFNRSDSHFTLSNLGREGKGLKYQALFQYLFDKDDKGSRERALRVGGELETTFGKKAFPLGIKILADLSTLQHEYEQSLNNILLEPYLLWHLNRVKIHLGGIALFSKNNNETQTDDNEYLPAIEVTYTLNSKFTLKGGWQGEVIKNNFHYLSSFNPYINDRVDQLENTIKRDIFAGVKWTSASLQFEVTGVYDRFKNMAFYLQDDLDNEQFNPIYDDGSYVGFEGSVKFEILKHVFLRSQIWQRFYSLDNEEKPWHMPSFGGDGQITYSGGEDIFHVSLIMHGENGLPYRTVGGTVGNLDPLIDLNLHGDYYFTPSWGAFAEVNNILGNNRERWHTYPTFGFNAKAGVLFRM